jgi:hypothetical protein
MDLDNFHKQYQINISIENPILESEYFTSRLFFDTTCSHFEESTRLILIQTIAL